MHTLHRLALVVVLTSVATLALGGMAVAQYPPSGGSITCDSSTVLAGEAFTCSASGFKARTSVAVTATGSTTGASAGRAGSAAGQWTYETTVRADGDGIATAVIQTPDNATGSTTVTFAGIGPNNQARVLSSSSAVTVTQPAAGDGTADPAPGPDDEAPAPGDGPADGSADGAADDGLAATGSDVALGLLVVAGLVVAGGALLLVARRRNRERVET